MSLSKNIIVFILLPLLGYTQIMEEIIGEWTKVKSEMADGSYAHKPFMEVLFAFNQDKTAIVILNGFEHKTNYKIKDSVIFFNTQTSYKIDKLTKDELIITQIDKNVTTKNLYRYYLNRKINNLTKTDSLTYIIIDLDTVYYAKPNQIEPTFKGSSVRKLFPYLIDKGAFKGENSYFVRTSFIINKKGQIGEIKVESLNDKIKLNVIKELESTDKFWRAATIEQRPVSTILNIVFEENKDVQKNIPRANFLYEKAVKYYQKKQYDKAIEAFTQSINLYPNRDAYFDRAAVYLEIGQADKACLDWRYLQNKGDKEVEILIKQYCK